jgi:ferredoxin
MMQLDHHCDAIATIDAVGRARATPRSGGGLGKHPPNADRVCAGLRPRVQALSDILGAAAAMQARTLPAFIDAAAAAAEPALEPSAHSRDEAWIDRARCPSCNECQLINDRMFGYDERKLAFIKDLGAGTYRQLVEAAESCQVAIIHPGAPRDPKEPGLEDLLARAETFR